jgi:hypothetical protein
MSEPKKFYKLVQDAAAEGEAPKAAEPSEGGKARIEAAPLLEGFEEDADFDRDPELEAKITGRPRPLVGAPEPALPQWPEFVKPGFGQAKHWAIVGAVLLVGAMVATGINAPNNPVYRILLTAYNALIHSGTGVVAVYIASRLLENRFGSVELAAGRMFAAVAALALIINLRVPFFTGSFAPLNGVILLLLAVGAYLTIVAATFKLWDRSRLLFVVGFHAVFWLVVQLGMALQGMVSGVVTKAAG